jgi:hypothetical protein
MGKVSTGKTCSYIGLGILAVGVVLGILMQVLGALAGG